MPIAYEGALKLKEISYVHAEAYPAGELKHGPLALVDEEMPVVVVAPNDQLLEKLKSNMEEVRARGGRLYVFCDPEADFEPQEGLEIIRRAWTEDQFSFKGDHFDLKDVHLEPTPVQQPHPPIWTAVMGRKSAKRAARFGFHVAGTGGENLQKMYDEELVRNDRNPKDFKISQLRLVYLAPTRDEAWETCQQHAHYMMDTYDKWLKEAADVKWFQETMSVSDMPSPEKLRDTPNLSFFEAPLMVGTPEDIIEEIERYQEASRVTHLVMWMQLAGMPTEKANKSMELFAKEVMPHFRN